MPKNNGNYILTSSRDEKTIRPSALAPEEYTLHGKNIVFPKDPQAGGSWIAYSESRTACLLNGGFQKHTFSPPYKKSRGLVLLDYFAYEGIKSFVEQYDFSGIEPFTLILLEASCLYELRWDEKKIHMTEYDPYRSYIWSSVTLYSEEIISERKNWFQSWLLSNSNYSMESIRNFHRSAGEGNPENDILMKRNDLLRTVSITSIEKENVLITFKHEDLIHNSLTTKVLEVV